MAYGGVWQLLDNWASKVPISHQVQDGVQFPGPLGRIGTGGLGGALASVAHSAGGQSQLRPTEGGKSFNHFVVCSRNFLFHLSERSCQDLGLMFLFKFYRIKVYTSCPFLFPTIPASHPDSLHYILWGHGPNPLHDFGKRKIQEESKRGKHPYF